MLSHFIYLRKSLVVQVLLSIFSVNTLIISNEEMNATMKIVKSIEGSDLLMKGVNETIKNKAKEKKNKFLSMLLGTLGASLLQNLSTIKGTIRAGEGTIRAGQDF